VKWAWPTRERKEGKRKREEARADLMGSRNWTSVLVVGLIWTGERVIQCSF